MKVLFLCTDNYTRSITAEFCLVHYLKTNSINDIEVASAGFKADSDLSRFSSVHLERMQELDIDLPKIVKRTQFREVFLDEFDVVVGMGKEHKDYIADEFGRSICLFNEIYRNEALSLTVPPPDNEGNFEREIRNMVDYIYDAMPVFVMNLRRKYTGQK